jgi:hypothetical protein
LRMNLGTFRALFFAKFRELRQEKVAKKPLPPVRSPLGPPCVTTHPTGIMRK